jgi:regulatory protein
MPPNKGCLPAAVKFLAARDHSEQDLRRKLLRRYDAAETDAAIAVLKARGYLDDRALAHRLAARYVEEGQYGRRGIQARLTGRGLPADAVDAALAGYDAAGEYERAAALIRRQFRTAKANDTARAGRFLAARGFAAETITALLSRVFGYGEND